MSSEALILFVSIVAITIALTLDLTLDNHEAADDLFIGDEPALEGE